eukprot:CAMPEP_0114580884 /NCGR_PEP_ID=MMETSP0125-20121206/5061_1 /TAXON_ID=485358 ORGANISM="Aristerostoma sp., Strain ATCC 50986" /NCGR_SAMPLE_ID=MMETSP0125 /ASSEMBLY_ACC=CAM_ASM_000245 /LENGTH=166 /DNA_ID=CAMNT_0001772675 /DNA_START=3369 /DNA_END=3869 /DNA_ORIENTATION=+
MKAILVLALLVCSSYQYSMPETCTPEFNPKCANIEDAHDAIYSASPRMEVIADIAKNAIELATNALSDALNACEILEAVSSEDPDLASKTSGASFIQTSKLHKKQRKIRRPQATLAQTGGSNVHFYTDKDATDCEVDQVIIEQAEKAFLIPIELKKLTIYNAEAQE